MEHIRKTNKKLGVGARGVVYEGYDEERGRFVAVKEIPFFDDGGVGTGGGDDAAEEDPAFVEERRAIVREITLMERFEHPNLVVYYGARRSAVGVQIIMELINGGSLDAIIRRQGSLRESVVRSYTHDILEGLAYLHDTARVCHRDVKPANVLITVDGRCKLTDFGVSKLLDDNVSMRTTVGTPWYMAPEVVNGNDDEDVEGTEDTKRYDGEGSCKKKVHKSSYTTAADIWSLGVTVFEMISGRKPFGGEMKNPAAVLFAIASSDGTPPRLPENCEASGSLRAFLDLCFVRDARLRPKARELLSHEWFTETSGQTYHGLLGNNFRRNSSSSNNNNNCSRMPGVVMPPPGSNQASLPAPLNMLDTADIMDTESRLSSKQCSPKAQRSEAKRRASEEVGLAFAPRALDPSAVREKNREGGFFSSDGHYVDLPLALPLAPSPLRRKEK
ncbi:protein kinase, putative [Trypanosoma cruzi marinkellei]|uniref:Protein kinase, putative n=1 Tax=Trypanosoma cruzi marinkellei TaxID=85056 RepID=K2N8K2_TRYCR|nr:protein kinase, putative [Trypanosoma cruzi marinkellei]